MTRISCVGTRMLAYCRFMVRGSTFRERRHASVSIVALVLGLAVVSAFGVAILGAADEPAELTCADGTTENVVSEFGGLALTGKSPDEALARSTAVLADAEIPLDAQVIVGEDSPRDGIVKIPSDVGGNDSYVKYQAYVDGKWQAEFYIEMTPEGEYWVSAYRFC
jgi:hypothetical protein